MLQTLTFQFWKGLNYPYFINLVLTLCTWTDRLQLYNFQLLQKTLVSCMQWDRQGWLVFILSSLFCVESPYLFFKKTPSVPKSIWHCESWPGKQIVSSFVRFSEMFSSIISEALTNVCIFIFTVTWTDEMVAVFLLSDTGRLMAEIDINYFGCWI